MKSRVKIVVTAGPSIMDEKKLKEIWMRGADVLRFNMTHITEEEKSFFVKAWRKIHPYNTILADLRGISIRISSTRREYLPLGEKVVLGKDIHIDPPVERFLEEGDKILIDDGKVVLEVVSVSPSVEAVVITGGRISKGKSVNLPGVELEYSLPTEKDKKDILWAIENDIDLFFLSFTNDKEDVKSVRDFIEDKGGDQWIVAKIESKKGVENAEEIARVSDGIVVARGDLGVEIPLEEVPLVQKELVRLGRRLGIPVVVATQMLTSMIENPFPTRAEVSDIVNAVLEGASAPMLSNETSVGKYPVEAVDVLNRIIKTAEDEVEECKDPLIESEEDLLALSAYTLSKAGNIRFIFVPTIKGYTLKKVARFTPKNTIISVVNSIKMARKSRWIYGTDVFITSHDPFSEEAFREAVEHFVRRGVIPPEEKVMWLDVRRGEQIIRVVRAGEVVG